MDSEPLGDQTSAERASATPARRRAIALYTAGCAGVGFLIGYFAGLSETPVVGTTLPLLFGLLGGSGGFYVSRADLKEPETVFRIQLLGISLAAFSFACVFGASYGAVIHNGNGWRDFLPFASKHNNSAKFLSKLALSDGFDMLALRARLQLVGANEEETNLLLDRAVEMRVDRVARILAAIDAGTTEVSTAKKVVAEGRKKVDHWVIRPDRPSTIAPGNYYPTPGDLEHDLNAASAVLDGYHHDLAHNLDVDLTIADEGQNFSDLMYRLETISNDEAIVKWSARVGVDVRCFSDLASTLEELKMLVNGAQLDQLWKSLDSALAFTRASSSDGTSNTKATGIRLKSH